MITSNLCRFYHAERERLSRNFNLRPQSKNVLKTKLDDTLSAIILSIVRMEAVMQCHSDAVVVKFYTDTD